MARKGIHSTDAKRYVRIAQFAGVGLGVLAVALWVMDVPGLSRTLPAKPRTEVRHGESETLPVAMQIAGVDPQSAIGIQERLDQAVKRPPPPKPEQQNNTREDDKDEPTSPPTAPVWRYLGAIREATRTLALVSIDGTQKIVGEGATIKIATPEAEGRPESTTYQATVATVQPDYIEIDEGAGKARRIDLEARTAKVSWVRNMPMTTPGAPIASTAAGLSPEGRQRLTAQGIDPAMAERARITATTNPLGRGRGTPNMADPAAMGVRGTTIVGGRAVPITPEKPTMLNDPTSSKTGKSDASRHRVPSETQN